MLKHGSRTAQRLRLAALASTTALLAVLFISPSANAASCTTDAVTWDNFVVGGKYIELRYSKACGGTVWWRENRTSGSYIPYQYGIELQTNADVKSGSSTSDVGPITSGSYVSGPRSGFLRVRLTYERSGQLEYHTRSWYTIP